MTTTTVTRSMKSEFTDQINSLFLQQLKTKNCKQKLFIKRLTKLLAYIVMQKHKSKSARVAGEEHFFPYILKFVPNFKCTRVPTCFGDTMKVRKLL